MHYWKRALIIFLSALVLTFFVYPPTWNKLADQVGAPHFPSMPFRLGLDLLGGTHLLYQADLRNLAAGQTPEDAMNGVRDVIERRVNIFGVAEPLVQVEGTDRLVVELAGVSDVTQAIRMIGETPFLQFKTERPVSERDAILAAQQTGQRLDEDPYYIESRLTGKYLTRAQVTIDNNGVGLTTPKVSLEFNSEGAELFKELTQQNLGRTIAIYLDGVPISVPSVGVVIPDGKAVIEGNFTLNEAKELATRLNAGALPVPISLISQQTIGASLGADSLSKSLKAGLFGLLLVAAFMILYYRLPGVVSVLALLVYVVIVLTVYKLIPVTLTLAGIAGFILSLGMAVDANVLIFARMREELKAGKSLSGAVNEGFSRAWLSIRDSHVTTLLSALVLYLFTTSIVKGFALTLGVGAIISLFTATVVTRTLLLLFVSPRTEKHRWLFG